jgi:hypothetical protein
VTTLGWVGVGLLTAAGLAIVVEGVLAAIWARAVARRSLTLAELLNSERGMLESDLERLRLAIEETQRLWRPYRTALRWLGHPLTIALWRSYRRRGMVR